MCKTQWIVVSYEIVSNKLSFVSKTLINDDLLMMISSDKEKRSISVVSFHLTI